METITVTREQMEAILPNLNERDAAIVSYRIKGRRKSVPLLISVPADTAERIADALNGR